MEKQSEQQELKDIIATREDGFGFRFKSARDEKNMSIDEVARELHLGRQMILALESEDYTHLPVAAFVCGYIRNYAKLLNIQPEPLIEYYKNVRSDDTLEPELKIIKEKAGSRQSVVFSILSAIMMPVFIVLIILALTGGAWKTWLYVSENYFNNEHSGSSQSIKLEALDSDDVEVSDDGADTLSLPVIDRSYRTPEEELIEQSTNSSLLEKNLDSLPSANDSLSSVNDSLSSVNDSLSSVNDSLSSVNDSPSPVNGSLSPVNDSSVVDESLVRSTSAPELGMKNQLILEFSGKSWVSIKDADNKILATGLKQSPKILTLNGATPYKVFLGDARVVRISINGKVFDHSKYINKKNIARFNVE